MKKQGGEGIIDYAVLKGEPFRWLNKKSLTNTSYSFKSQYQTAYSYISASVSYGTSERICFNVKTFGICRSFSPFT